ncbi:DUF5951 family protein [Kluyvera ascorbata]
MESYLSGEKTFVKHRHSQQKLRKNALQDRHFSIII